jgi:hypothetical protein
VPSVASAREGIMTGVFRAKQGSNIYWGPDSVFRLGLHHWIDVRYNFHFGISEKDAGWRCLWF